MQKRESDGGNHGGRKYLAVFVDRVAQPVDAWIIADLLVLHIDEDNLEVLVGSIL
jgi:hypothetical protein